MIIEFFSNGREIVVALEKHDAVTERNNRELLFFYPDDSRLRTAVNPAGFTVVCDSKKQRVSVLFGQARTGTWWFAPALARDSEHPLTWEFATTIKTFPEEGWPVVSTVLTINTMEDLVRLSYGAAT